MSESASDARIDPTAPSRLSQYWRPAYWPTWVLWAWMQLTARMPFPLALWIHSSLGRLLHALPSRLRANVHTNLALSFPDLSPAERDGLAKRHFAALGATFAECAIAWFASDRHLEGRFEIKGAEHLRAALEQGRGVILLAGHFTGLEICGRQLKNLVPHFACMYSHRSNALLDEIQRRGRMRCTHESIPSDRVRAMLASLKRNGVVWYAPDQAALGKNAVLVPFFAEQAMMTTATSKLARVTQAPIVPLFNRRLEGRSRYEIEIHPPLEDFPSEDIVADTHRLAAMIESFVREAPEQYMWGQKKFRGRPGLPDPYTRRSGEDESRPDTGAVARR